MTNRTIELSKEGVRYIMNSYGASTYSPRPEGYAEDIKTASEVPPNLRPMLFHEIASTAETGWDFSTRWMKDKNNLSSLQTSTIIPVDLNSIMYKNEIALSNFFNLTGDHRKSHMFRMFAGQRAIAMEQVLWNNKYGMWFDYCTKTSQFNDQFYPSNLMPLWAEIPHDYVDREKTIDLISSWNILSYPGGVPTSFYESTQQWDYPNAWPPLQWFLVKSLKAINATDMANRLVRTWVESNFVGWNNTKGMFEKYNATAIGQPGGGGEYTPQLGFGWTNGIALDLLINYSD